ncbi:MAG TPA: iron-containing alcohol dehydrogenase [Terriglobales bacterium]|nr:iron-containing alcohol dehydrogenase [Terriglobales bacterium]
MSLKGFETKLNVARVAMFDQPKRIIFATGAAEQYLGSEAVRLAGKRTLVVTDKGVKKAGMADTVVDLIKKEHLEVTLYDNIAAEPTADSVRAAVQFGREGKYDVVVGIGGGAVLDTAKMTAICLTNPEDVMTYVDPTQDKTNAPSKPKILIPTTSGTGSETSNCAVVIEGLYKTWIATSNVFADVAIVDPNMVISCPPRQTAGSAMDALSHNVEGLIDREANPISDAQALEGTKLVFNYATRAYHAGDDLEARWNMAAAATLGGMVIAYPWIGGPAILGHCIAEALGPRWGVPHGAACGVVLPYILKFNMASSGCMEKLAYVAKQVLGDDVHGLSQRDAADVFIQATMTLMEDMELPTNLKEWKVPSNELDEFAEYVVKDRQFVYGLPRFNPRKLTNENTKELMHNMYDGVLN